METVQIQMLGEFALSTKNQRISNQENRSRKVWLLLAYLVYHRHRVVTNKELMSLLWGDSPRGSNTDGALKTTFHRARAALDRLWSTAGHDLVLRREGGYTWNTDIPVQLDIDQFDRLFSDLTASKDVPLALCIQLLDLYKGDFLARMSNDPWVSPIADQYRQQYLSVLLKALPLLRQQGKLEDVVRLCQAAAEVVPCHEELHIHLLESLIQLNDHWRAVTIYEELSDQLFSKFGRLPCQQLRDLYHQASRSCCNHALTMDTVIDFLTESDSSPAGALMCDYDFFAVVCRSVARSLSRTGLIAHIALLTVVGKDGTELSSRSLPRVMKNLEEQIRTNLRRGDTAALCSASQYVLMLPQANYENSCMVCNRIIKSFQRKYPHSPANFRIAVHPLNPST